jgi:hypothetical protein
MPSLCSMWYIIGIAVTLAKKRWCWWRLGAGIRRQCGFFEYAQCSYRYGIFLVCVAALDFAAYVCSTRLTRRLFPWVGLTHTGCFSNKYISYRNFAPSKPRASSLAPISDLRRTAQGGSAVPPVSMPMHHANHTMAQARVREQALATKLARGAGRAEQKATVARAAELTAARTVGDALYRARPREALQDRKAQDAKRRAASRPLFADKSVAIAENCRAVPLAASVNETPPRPWEPAPSPA